MPEMGRGGPPRPKTEVLALYLVFRAAQVAAGNGRLRSQAYDTLVARLTQRIETIWEKMFQAEEPEALAWVLERLQLMGKHPVNPVGRSGA